VDWTSDGTAWAITIGIGGANLQLRAYTSSDGGATWTFDSTPSGSQTSVDREIMWVDHSPTSPFTDQIYVIWHQGAPGFVATRTTGAGAAWQTPVQVTGTESTGTAIGGDIKTNSAGDVFAFWPEDGGHHQVHVAKSTDGGTTFGTPVTIATLFATQRQISIPADASPDRMARVYISGGAYKTASKDLAYVVWTDLSGESGCTSGLGPGSDVSSSCKSRIWFARSTDGGATWTAPAMINNQSGKNDQFHSRLCVDETDGKLVVVYNDTIADPGRLKTDIWMQYSEDDGLTWSAAVKVTSAETDETAASASSFSYGDYLGLSGYAGTFFPSWTDRRNGAAEEIWTAPIVLVPKAAAFVLNRNPLGQDEIDARRAQPPNSSGGLPVPDAFRVTVDGFTAAELGLSGPSSTLAMVPTLSPGTGMTVLPVGNSSDNGDYGPEVQRFTFFYNLDFPDDSAFGFSAPTKTVTLAVTAGTQPASAQLELIKQPDPFILHGDPSWLSVDLRVFVVTAGETQFGATMGADASAAPGFIQQVIANITPAQFDSLPTLEDDAAGQLFLQPTNGSGQSVFNFAIAQVHYIGLIGASNVRVFFRLFSAQSTVTAFDETTTYRRAPANPSGQPIPLAGIQGSEYVTIPCFATARVDSTAESMALQTDDFNRHDFASSTGVPEVDHFYGCWLDINQPFEPDGVTPNNVLPLQVPATNVDGAFSDAVPIQQAILRNLHQCLVAEIAFDAAPIPAGSDTGNWDKLAQRNLAWSDVGSAQALSTFEIRPTRAVLPAGQTPDELMIDWGDIPSGTSAQFYLPAVSVAEVLALAERMYTSHRLTRVDQHTLQCQTGGVTYIPIPRGGDTNYAGLLSVDIPATPHRGQSFSVVVRQLTNAFGRAAPPPPPPPRIDASPRATEEGAAIEWRRVLGAFQITIPVRAKVGLLAAEERNLSVLRWIGEAIPHHNRWHPVFGRYLEGIAGRVTSFGGDPTEIEPSPTGDGRRTHPRHEPRALTHGITGKITGLIFDHFGDFEGFVLDTPEREYRFLSREGDVAELAERAWRERLRLTVWVEDDHDPCRPLRIVIRQPPASFGG
jgi:hypothetical protein